LIRGPVEERLDYWRFRVEFTVSQELLLLRHGDSSNLEEGEHLPLETVNKGRVKKQQTEMTQ
jgi:hypothetical protein